MLSSRPRKGSVTNTFFLAASVAAVNFLLEELDRMEPEKSPNGLISKFAKFAIVEKLEVCLSPHALLDLL
jgi:hypothetical protein